MGLPARYAFLHGGGQGSWVWEETVKALKLQGDASPCEVLTLDVPGCGTKRERTTQGMTFDHIVEELISDIDDAGLTNLVLIGHSQAGTVLPAMAERRPDLFRRLIYVSCSLPLPGQTIIQMIGDRVHGEVDEEVGWPVDPKTTSNRKRAEIMLCNDMSVADTAAFMQKLGDDNWPQASYQETNWRFGNMGEIPSSYVLCLRDNILPIRWQTIFAQRFHAQRIVQIDAGHQVMTTQAQALAELIRSEV